jgi:uroporphyrinogen-III synthase
MILVSRPAPQLPRTVAALRRAGFKQLCPLPVAEYESFTLDTFPADATALILTSAAALTALMTAVRTVGPMEKRPGCLRFLPAYCVGAATARAAKKAGLNVVFVGKGSCQTLAATLASQKLPPQKFLHLHADNALSGWADTLTAVGHSVAGLSAYHTAYLHTLPATVVSQIKAKQPTHTLLFSPAGAQRLGKLLQKSNLQPSGTAVAMSPAVAKAAQDFWPQILVSPQPSLAGMLKALKTQGAAQ